MQSGATTPEPATRPDQADEARLERWERITDLPLTAASVVYLAVYAVQVLAFRPDQPA